MFGASGGDHVGIKNDDFLFVFNAFFDLGACKDGGAQLLGRASGGDHLDEAPKTLPRRLQDASKTAQDAPETAQDAPTCTKAPQDATKTPPRGSQERPRRP